MFEIMSRLSEEEKLMVLYLISKGLTSRQISTVLKDFRVNYSHVSIWKLKKKWERIRNLFEDEIMKNTKNLEKTPEFLRYKILRIITNEVDRIVLKIRNNISPTRKELNFLLRTHKLLSKCRREITFP